MTNPETNERSLPQQDRQPAQDEQKPADPRLEEIYRRVASGDTSVVSDVYWIQMLE